MIYNPTIGKIYDSIFFLVEYFNKDLVSSEFKKIYGDTSMMTACYEEVEKTIPEIPKLLSPLFYMYNGMTSPIASFFTNQLDFQCDDIDSFINRIRKNSDILYQKTSDSIFSNYSNASNRKLIPLLTPGEYINELDSLTLPAEFKLQIALLLGNFNYAIGVLSDTLKNIYDEVNKLHENHAKNLLFAFEHIQTENNLQLYKNAIQYDKDLYDTTSVSVSLLNHYLIYYKIKSNNFFMLLGLKHEDSISDKYDESKSTAENFIITCGSEIRMKMIRTLIENKEMTSTQMAKYIGCPNTTLIRNIDAMENGGIIYISRHEGLQIFYKLNIKLLRRIKMDIDGLFEQLFTNGGQNEKGYDSQKQDLEKADC